MQVYADDGLNAVSNSVRTTPTRDHLSTFNHAKMFVR